MEEIMQMVGNLGFPIVMSIYLTVKIENKIDNLNTSIIKLSNAINNLEKAE